MYLLVLNCIYAYSRKYFMLETLFPTQRIWTFFDRRMPYFCFPSRTMWSAHSRLPRGKEYLIDAKAKCIWQFDLHTHRITYHISVPWSIGLLSFVYVALFWAAFGPMLGNVGSTSCDVGPSLAYVRPILHLCCTVVGYLDANSAMIFDQCNNLKDTSPNETNNPAAESNAVAPLHPGG